jgi:hypothetical protein
MRLLVSTLLVLLCGTLRAEPHTAAPPGLPAAQRDLVRRTYRVLPGSSGLVYLAATVGVVVADVADPAHPVYVGVVPLPDSVNDLAWVAGKLVAAIGPSGVAIIDAKSPGAPRLVSRLKLAGAAMGLSAQGDMVLVASGTAGLQIVDLSTPEKPRKVAHHDTPGYARAVRVSGHLVYLADGPRGVAVLNLEGQRLRDATVVPTKGHVYDIDVEGESLLVAEGHAGLARYNISDSTRPRLAGRLPVEDTARGVDASGRRAVVADGTKGVILVDAAGAPRALDRFMPERSANSAVLQGDRVLVANDYDGLLILAVSPEGKLSRLGSLPPPGK